MGVIGLVGQLIVVLVGGCMGQYSVQQAFEVNEVVPDLVSSPPRTSLEVYYPTGARLMQGNILRTSQLKEMPMVMWRANPYRYYTLIVADPDAPSRIAPEDRAWLHLMVINIPGANVAAGETVFDYLPPGPPPNTGLHRYVFLVYEQPSRISYWGPREFKNRGKFCPDHFAAQYGLGFAYAGNFFLTQNEEN
ncbi:hypothetical protein ABMA28_002208 [Loxostege sticticalis]|uniref:Phosphatidylethanolamine-binding protein n=1 Tax=Loxostege sticticalis TaxID=481309 RepID=A0ABD0T4B4_LOXSC